LSSTCLVSLFQWYADTRDLHSFPTRRSSDLRRHHDTVVGGRHLERVEVRVGRRPRAWLGEVDAPREAPVDDRERHAVDAHLGRIRFTRHVEAGEGVAAHDDGADLLAPATLEPHGLPDARGGGERDAVVVVARNGALLAVHDLALVGRRLHLHDELTQATGDLALARHRAAGVLADQFPAE